jgi:hypothetical protein
MSSHNKKNASMKSTKMHKMPNVSSDNSAPGEKVGKKGQKIRGTGAATKGLRAMGPLA